MGLLGRSPSNRGGGQEHPSYAPELNIVGAAVGGVGVDPTGSTLRWGHYLTVPGGFEIPGMRKAFEAIRLGQATPSTAMYVYHAVHDQNMAVADVDGLVEKLRGDGVDVTYRRFRLGEHVIVTFAGARGALRFLSERFGGA